MNMDIIPPYTPSHNNLKMEKSVLDLGQSQGGHMEMCVYSRVKTSLCLAIPAIMEVIDKY